LGIRGTLSRGVLVIRPLLRSNSGASRGPAIHDHPSCMKSADFTMIGGTLRKPQTDKLVADNGIVRIDADSLDFQRGKIVEEKDILEFKNCKERTLPG